MSTLPTTPNEYTGTITGMTRASSSTNGNPAYFVEFDNGVPFGVRFRTQTDSSVGYEIDNYAPRRHPEPVTVTLTRAGRITAIRSAVSA